MAIKVLIDRVSSQKISSQLIDSMLELRRAVFHDRLHWNVHIDKHIELDFYDVLAPYYIVAFDSNNRNQCLGCARLLPTTGPYMLKDIFPILIDGDKAPEDKRIWEISRFAISDKHTAGQFGFSNLPAEILRAMVRFAINRNISTIVGVTTIALERMASKLGFTIERLGSMHKIGNAKSIAIRLPMSNGLLDAICENVKLDNAA